MPADHVAVARSPKPYRGGPAATDYPRARLATKRPRREPTVEPVEVEVALDIEPAPVDTAAPAPLPGSPVPRPPVPRPPARPADLIFRRRHVARPEQ